MVEIVCVTKFCEAGAKTFSEYIRYIDRKEAVRRRHEEKFNLFGDYMDYMDDETKAVAREQKGMEQVSALFTVGKNNLSPEERRGLKKAFRDAQSRGSNMWQTVISFDNRYLAQQGLYSPEDGTLNEVLLKQAARKGICAMLQNEEMDHALWTASIHYNTDNIHIHVAIVEPTPMRESKTYTRYMVDADGKFRIDENGEKIPVLDEYGTPVTYEGYKGRFKGKSHEILKSAIRAELEDNSEIYACITSIMRDTIIADKRKRNLLDTPKFVDKMTVLYSELKATGASRRDWNYNQNMIRTCRPLIDDLSRYFITAYHRDDYEKLIAEIDAEQAKQETVYGGKSDYKEKILYGKEGLYARLGNAILKELKEYDRILAELHQMSKNKGQKSSASRPNINQKRILHRGLRQLEYDLQSIYSKMRNLREAELLQEEIAARGHFEQEL